MMTIIHIVEVAIVAKILYRVANFLLGRKINKKGKKEKGIIGKLLYLTSRNIHYRLDDRIKAQKEKRLANSQQTSSNVVSIQSYKKAKAK